MTRFLVAGAGSWIGGLEATIRATRGMSLSARCEELTDLLALGGAGLGDVAVLAGDIPGLDLDSVSALHRAGMTVVAVAASPDAREWLSRLGVDRTVEVPAASVDWRELLSDLSGAQAAQSSAGSCLSVWGPPGGPGASTVAIALGLASAASGSRTLLIDLDPASASIAQQLGLPDAGSGVERACRAAQSGSLTSVTLGSLVSATSKGLDVLTGVLRPARWIDLRRSALEAVVGLAREEYDRVVLDVGTDIYDPEAGEGTGTPRPGTATSVGIDAADRLVLVGAADSVGMARLLRGVDRLVTGSTGSRRTDVVVNRWRPGVGWSRNDLTRLLAEVAPNASTHVLPDDTAAADAAMLCGGSPWLCRISPEKGAGSALGWALHDLTASVLGEASAVTTGRRFRLAR